jgi:hypothetical protein
MGFNSASKGLISGVDGVDGQRHAPNAVHKLESGKRICFNYSSLK